MAVRLSARMTALADMVTLGARLADIGTDHGYIPVYLCRTGKIPGAIAMDVNRGPLQRARQHVAESGLQDQIDLRLSDGLAALAPNEADVILIAGMGGALIKRILTDGEAVLEANSELVLQPQSEIASVRTFLRENGYAIVDEDCIFEDGKFYFAMKAHRVSGGVPERYLAGFMPSEKNKACVKSGRLCLEDAFGPILLKKKHPVLRQYLEQELAVIQEICIKLSKQMDFLEKTGVSDEDDGMNLKKRNLKKRLYEMQEKERLVNEALDCYI